MKKLHMIGNSHIDPVWFWDKAEGMQAVKATFRSALDRMKEYPDFTFTASSAQFYQWIEKIDPDMFEEIKQRVKEGRWLYVGGWIVEPDCNMPCGEAFVRQGLYGQRYFKKTFGAYTTIGFCVDSFGHNHNLPQLLKKAGLNYYVYMRPIIDQRPPLFRWQSKDGTAVTAVRLMGEYTTWFDEKLKVNIDSTLEILDSYGQYPCFFGVGNHGGGPTIQNIEGLLKFKAQYAQEVELEFSSLQRFFEVYDASKAPVYEGELEKCNVGCYSIQSDVKRMNRLAENALLRAERLNMMGLLLSGVRSASVKEFEEIWSVLLFNQFHDVLPGTSIKEAAEQVLHDLSRVVSLSKDIENHALQAIAQTMNTYGEGFPLLLFNPHGYKFFGEVEVEAEWFCKDELVITDGEGQNVPYQRVRASAPMNHMNLAGRRRFLFTASIPPMGFAVYKLHKTAKQISQVAYAPAPIHNPELVLDNGRIRCAFDSVTGMLCSLIDHGTGTELIDSVGTYKVFTDGKDAWGSGPGVLGYFGEHMRLKEITKVEEGTHRSTIRTVHTYNNSELIQLHRLYANAEHLEVYSILRWNEPNTRLKLSYTLNLENVSVQAEMPYGFIDRQGIEVDDAFMQRYINVSSPHGAGVVLANDSKYAYSLDRTPSNKTALDITVLRSTIYAHGTNTVPWYHESETYRYTDLGEQTFTLAIRPHGGALEPWQAHRLADRLNMPSTYLADSWHHGAKPCVGASLASTEASNVIITAIKQPENGAEGVIIRLLETDGGETDTLLHFQGKDYPIHCKPFEIKTLLLKDGKGVECNFLEENCYDA